MQKQNSEHRNQNKNGVQAHTGGKIQIIFQDKWLCVIEKPSGILSVPFDGWHGKTVISTLEEIMRKNGTYSMQHKPYAVHRLDRDTSGVMMFALSEFAKNKIMDSWQSLVSERLYIAVAENPRGDRFPALAAKGTIDDDISYNAYNRGYVRNYDSKRHPSNYSKAREYRHYNHDSARQNQNHKQKTVTARTHYKILESGKFYTMFELSLDTGRKNQIRAHLASRGYVIAGDTNYKAVTNPFGRLALHARSLCFTHPFTHEKMCFEIDEPAEWKKLVTNDTCSLQ